MSGRPAGLGRLIAIVVAPLSLAAARGRRRPGRWIGAAAGIALATAFGAALAGEATVAGDGAARRALAGLSARERAVRVIRSNAASPAVDRAARGVLDRLGLGAQTRTVLLNPVRLGDTVVRVAAIRPLGRWVSPRRPPGVAACRARACPLLLAGPPAPPPSLRAPGVRIRVVGRARLQSAAPLGFVPRTGAAAAATPPQPPFLVGGDPAGLDGLSGLGGIFRTDTWSAALPIAALHSWDLAGLRQRLERANARLVATSSDFTLEAPFRELAHAAAEARSAPRRLLLVAGGGLAALAAFVVLVAGSLRRDVAAELERMRAAGATRAQRALFALAEAAVPSAVGVVAGAGAGVAATVVLAGAAGAPVGDVLLHSLLTPLALAVAVGGLGLATVLLGALLLAPPASAPAPRPGLADLLAVVAAAAIAVAIARGGAGSASDPLPLLLIPLSCVAAGAIAFRLAGGILRGAERLSRRAPLAARLALVNLARAGTASALAAAFVTIAVALGGFAIVYRATLLRGVADQAADRVPLDATVRAGPSFVTPLEEAPLSRWRALAGGDALPVDRTQASHPVAGQTATVPAIGLPARGLALLHGWRASDASAPRSVLAGRLRWPGAARTPGPTLPPAARSLRAEIAAAGADVAVRAELRDPRGEVRSLRLGRAGPDSRLTATLPGGRWELEALELSEPTALAATNAHQSAESGAVTPIVSARVRVRSIEALAAGGRPLRRLSIARWRAVGAAGGAHPVGRGVALRFATRGTAGVLRPVQPSDSRPLPILADPATASGAGPGGRLPLTVDGAGVTARVVGVLRRFPTLAPSAGGFLVADQAQLTAAVDAAEPGAGRPNELWLASADPGELRRAIASPRFRELSSTFRADVEHALRSDPVASGILGGLVAAAAISLVIACLGLVVVLVGSGRDPALERDLAAQGLGPRALRADLRLRAAATAGLGVLGGLVVAVALGGLAVAAVRAGTTLAAPRPPFVTVVPWLSLIGWTALVAAGIAAAVTLAGAGRGRAR